MPCIYSRVAPRIFLSTSTPSPPIRNRTGVIHMAHSQKFWSTCMVWSTSMTCVPTAVSTPLWTKQSGSQMRTCGALRRATCARARSSFLMRLPSCLLLACFSCLASPTYKESTCSRAMCSIRPAGDMTSTSAESASAYWAAAALRKQSFSIVCYDIDGTSPWWCAMSAQVAVYPEHIEGPNSHCSKFCAHADVVPTWSKFRFIFGNNYNTVLEIHTTFSTADTSLLRVHKMGIFLHAIRACYLPLHHRREGTPYEMTLVSN